MYDPNADDGLQESLRVKRHVYLAAPFFTEEQVDLCEWAERIMETCNISFFSPRLDCRYTKGDPPIVAHRAFWLNRHHISTATLVVALLDWPDVGTAWELGFAYATGAPRLGVVGSAPELLNLMIANTCHGVVSSKDFDTVVAEAITMQKRLGRPAVTQYLQAFKVDPKEME
jgi:nucleoside 2-deoxyribosyltransferase